jgi:hypothetical protein
VDWLTVGLEITQLQESLQKINSDKKAVMMQGFIIYGWINSFLICEEVEGWGGDVMFRPSYAVDSYRYLTR